MSSPPLDSLKVIFDLAASSPLASFTHLPGSARYVASPASSQTAPAVLAARMTSPYWSSGDEATVLPTMPKRFGPVLPPYTTSVPSAAVIE